MLRYTNKSKFACFCATAACNNKK
uniref:Uncharacterized protein n=1 Tax=Rhizophora mucronata TaxID=61149 RepID=A0A2P2K3P6_RHIMU